MNLTKTTDQGVMSGIITEPIFLDTFPKMASSYKLGSIQALVVAIYEIGCLLGSFMIIGFGDKLGRRRAVLVGTVIMLVGTAIQASSTTMAQLIVGRVVTGAGNGMNTSSIPVWQSEIAPPKTRGFLVLFEGALITAGVMISYWINYGLFFYNASSFQWRFPVAFQAFFGFILIAGIFAFPESPRWLLKHGKEKEATQVMARLKDCDIEDKELKKEINEIKKINELTDGTKLSVKEFFSNGEEMNLWRASIAFAAQAFQQIGGINLVTYYATVVFEDSLGFDPTFARLLTGVLGTEYFLAALVALFVVDRLGRRRLMMWNAAGMGLAMMVAGIGLSQGTHGGALAATVMIFLFNTFFAIGWLGITWLYPAEVTPMRIRAEANGLSTSANWLFNYAVVQLSPIMINSIAWKTYFVFMCFNFAFIPVVYYTFVETNGYKLETMDEIFRIAHKNGENPVKVEKRFRKDNAEGSADSEKSSSVGGASEKFEDEHKEDATAEA
ncbi:general substrate transporter [Aureobasidium sp. EXF-12298]|nr:general substrate transporter [Aureobasidium sp. EXF-12298]KAI4765013.1 general substrate transporter [Aureobasidium sp. EXF-12344]KAI4784858.1 general substrate transporter [Aureobasidium sp. EXF-3400]